MFRGRRRLLVLLSAAVLAVAAAAAGVAALVANQPPGDVSNPDVPFAEETPTPTATPEPAPKRRAKSFAWPRYGYTKDHRRTFDPPKPLHPPFNTRWKRKAPALLEFPPVLTGKVLYQLADNGVLTATAINKGRRKWRRKIGHLSASTPAVDGRHLIATVLERSRGVPRGRIVSMRLRDGGIRWKRELPSRSESSPLVHEGRVYFGTEDGTLFCLAARTGRIVWRYKAAGAIKASPTLSGGNLYFGDYGGQVQAVRIKDGRRVWAEPVGRRAVGDGEFYATAAVAFGRVYVGATDGRMYSLSAQDGRLAWAHQTGNYVYSSPAVTRVAGRGPTVFFGSYDGVFYALDARTGNRRWIHRSGGRISGGPTVIGDVVYYANLGRSLTFGLGTGTGRVMVRFKLGGYDPVISDGRHLFVTGRRSLTAYLPRNR